MVRMSMEGDPATPYLLLSLCYALWEGGDGKEGNGMGGIIDPVGLCLASSVVTLSRRCCLMAHR